MKSATLIACLKSIQQLIRLPLMFVNGGFTRPQRTEKSREGHSASESPSPLRGARRTGGAARKVLCHASAVYPRAYRLFPSPLREKVAAGRMRGYSLGFTLIEILVVVLIIGILGAIALPQYQRAVLKSRFAALMPIAKSMADSNEAFYLEHGEYADNAEDLPIQGRRNYSDGTELEFGTLTGYSYVLATRDNDFPNNYIVYQKHSENFPGEVHCEAASDNTLAQDVCKSFGPTQELGETLTSGYLTYVLFGTGNGVAPTEDEGGDEPSEPEEPETPTCAGVTCDAQGNITECASGLTLNNGACVTCDIPNATSCSATSYAATACGEGYNLTNGACDPTIQTKVNAVLASSTCTGYYAGSCHDNGDGTISKCVPGHSTYDAEHNKCMPSYEPNYGFDYEKLYNADGKLVEEHMCYTTSTSGSECYRRNTYTYDPATGNKVSEKRRSCQTDVVMDENWNCANGGTYSMGQDQSFSPTTRNTIAEYKCPANSGCSTYDSMTEWNDTRTQKRTCKTRNNKNGCDEWNDWVSGTY